MLVIRVIYFNSKSRQDPVLSTKDVRNRLKKLNHGLYLKIGTLRSTTRPAPRRAFETYKFVTQNKNKEQVVVPGVFPAASSLFLTQRQTKIITSFEQL